MQDYSQIISFITGAGGAAGVMWLWNRALIQDKKDLVEDIKAERDRNNKFGEAWMALATETKIHLQQSTVPVDEIKETVQGEHKKTRDELSGKLEEIKPH